MTSPDREHLNQYAPGFYVYTHASKHGRVFYVGKGTGKRAWIHGRDALWRQFVDTRLKGEYVVAIVESGLSEVAALELEDRLLKHYGDQLVNRINMGRGVDVAAIDRQRESWRRRDVLEEQARSTVDPIARSAKYAEALEVHHEACRLVIERGVVGELLAEVPVGRIVLIEGQVRALLAASNPEAARSALDTYLARYPEHRTHTKATTLDRAIARGFKRAAALAR